MKSRKDCSTHLPTLVTADFLTDCSQSNWKVWKWLLSLWLCLCWPCIRHRWKPIQDWNPICWLDNTTRCAIQFKECFGSNTAVYVQWNHNIMLNQYSPDLVVPIDESNCTVCESWFIEKTFEMHSKTYIHESLLNSKRVHEEDFFLCENVQLGLQSLYPLSKLHHITSIIDLPKATVTSQIWYGYYFQLFH